VYLPFVRSNSGGELTGLPLAEQIKYGQVTLNRYALPIYVADAPPRVVDMTQVIGVAFVASGEMRTSGDRDVVAMTSGQIMIKDGAQITDVISSPDVRSATLMVSKSALNFTPREADILATTVFDATAAGPALLWATARRISASHGQLSGAVAARLSEATVDIVAATALEALERVPEPDSYRRRLVLECLEYVEAHLAYPGLGPNSVAQALHVSVRTLHLAFEDEAVTVARLILLRRLERTRADLESLRLPALSVAEVGERWGFQPASRFSTVFKNVYGLSPSEYRAGRRHSEAFTNDPQFVAVNALETLVRGRWLTGG
jgi:AraC-like DNA-binding protein